jgi:ParB family chromosome partitioning protein
MTRKALGRGLEALISGSTAAVAVEGRTDGLREIPINDIAANPFQPRTRFDDEAIRELAASIKANGVLQPLIVRRSASGDFELVAGERRLRASRTAGLDKVPVVVRDVEDREMMELALVENIQRENLNPIDEARAFQALIDKVGLTHDQVSERVGKQRSSITNSLRLLSLPADVAEMVSRGTLTAGHARAILSLENAADQLGAARYVTAKGFSVRRTEAYVRRRLRKQHTRPRTARLEGLREWEVKLQQRFGTHVSIAAGRKGGKVEFEFYSQDDLERLFEAWGMM